VGTVVEVLVLENSPRLKAEFIWLAFLERIYELCGWGLSMGVRCVFQEDRPAIIAWQKVREDFQRV
jgi:hypothetical protein